MAALRALSVAALICCCAGLSVRDQQPKFSVIAFFTAKKDPAHISFVHEAEHWYHNTFLGSGSYVSNTWRPTSAILRVEDRNHPATAHLPETFRSSPSEWYRWEKDLRQNPDIDILLSIDSTSFPLGTGPKPHEI